VRKKPILLLVICGTLVVLALFASGYFPAPGPGTPAERDEISIGLSPAESSALVYIAEEKGFFAQEGLILHTRFYPNGAVAVQGMENGEVNLTLSAEFPLVAETLNGRKFLIAGTVDKFYGTYLVGRKDRGIAGPGDLAGKTIAIQKNSIGEFYLGRFLDLQGTVEKNVTLVNRPVNTIMPDMLENTSIDAVVTTPLNTYLLVGRQPESFTVIPVISGQATYVVVAGNRDWVRENPRAVSRFLLAVRDASRYAVADPKDAKSIVARRLNVSEDYIGNIWPDHQYSLALDQSLLIAMEDEARWMIHNNLTASESVPNFLDSVYSGGMESADPDSVTLIRQRDGP
jgi:NitT/TauT family transport system substrate-binding protein